MQLHQAVVLMAGSIVVGGAVMAGGMFELDGNTSQDGAGPAEDWGLLFDRGANTGGSSVAFTGIVPDAAQTTIFSGGQKDIQDVTQWRWKQGGVPDKNELTNAFAAAYVVDGELIIYFGADRYSNTGDAYVGYWFFKDRVRLNANGTFDGAHTVGDVLVLMNYTGSGPMIEVMEWNPALADVADNLRLLYSGPAALCGDVPPSPACAITNMVEMLSPWPYESKDAAAGVFPVQSFFEGGINLSAMLGGTACFSSFLAESRSSTSVTASLKDFVIGEFPVCGIDVETTCAVMRLADESDPTDKLYVADFEGAVVNSAAGIIPAGSHVTIIHDAGTPGDNSDDAVIEDVLVDPFAPGDELLFSGTFFTDSNPPTSSVTAFLEFDGEIATASVAGVECEPIELNSALSVSNMCWVGLDSASGSLGVKVELSGAVENTGDVPLFVIVVDDMAGEVLAPTFLMPGESAAFAGSYVPVQANGGEDDPACAMFSNTVTAVGENFGVVDPIMEVRSTTCSLCPNSPCGGK